MFDEYKIQINLLKSLKKNSYAAIYEFKDDVFAVYSGVTAFRITGKNFFLDKSKLTINDLPPFFTLNEKDKLLEISDDLKQINNSLLNVLRCDDFKTYANKSLLDLFDDDYEFYSQGPESVIKCVDAVKGEVYGIILPYKFDPFPKMKTEEETAEQVSLTDCENN